MSNVKITQLGLAPSISIEDNFVLVHGGQTEKTTAGNIFDTVVSNKGLATVTYVNTAIANLIDNAPAALNTLKELAAAINNNPNIYSIITGKLNTTDFTSTANTWLGTKNSDNVIEGNTHLFFTTARARGAISASGSISYNSTTGVISFSGNTDAISEGSSNLYFTNARARAAIVPNDGNLDYSTTTGQLSISDTPTFTSITLTGAIVDPAQAATKNYVDSQINDVVSSDLLNIDGGEIVFTGSSFINQQYSLDTLANVAYTGRYSDLLDKPNAFSGNWVDIIDRPVFATLATSGSWTDLVNKPSTSDIPEGNRKYYTDSRVDQRVVSFFATRTTDSLVEGTNHLYFTDARVSSALTTLLPTLTTDNIAQGNTNKYYSDDLVLNYLSVHEYINRNWAAAYLDSLVANINNGTTNNSNLTSTDDLSEGEINLYFTNARARAAISTGAGLSYNSSTGIITADTDGGEIIFAGEVVNGVETGDIGFAPVAISGSYNDLTDKPSLFTGSYNDLTNKPNLEFAPVARSGDFRDLSNLPTSADIPESGTHRYFTDARAVLTFETLLTNSTTSALREGDNLYFTEARVRQSLSAGEGVEYNNETGIITSSSRLVNVPTSSVGSIGDKKGYYAISDDTLYVCNKNFDGESNIWTKFVGATSW